MSDNLTPRQKNLIVLMPDVEAGKISLKEAMIQAGYAQSTAEQQSTILGGLRSNAKMQEALQKAGFTEDYLAQGIVEGTKAIDGSIKVVRVKVDDNGEEVDEEVDVRAKPDYRTRGVYYKLGAELLDAFPVKKSVEATVGIDELINQQEATTPEQE